MENKGDDVLPELESKKSSTSERERVRKKSQSKIIPDLVASLSTSPTKDSSSDESLSITPTVSDVDFYKEPMPSDTDQTSPDRSSTDSTSADSTTGQERGSKLVKLNMKRWESSSSTSSYTPIPTSTSQWSSDVIKLIKISIVRDKLYPPLKFSYSNASIDNKPLVEWLKNIVLKTKYVTTYNVLETKVRKMVDHLKMFKPLMRLDFENIEQIKDNESYLFQENLDTGSTEFTSVLPVLNPTDHWEKSWNHLFFGCAALFVADLKYIISLHASKQSIPESMYSTLFLHFIGMFGLKGVAVPSVPARTLLIDGVEVKSIPDILLLDRLNVKKETNGAYSTNVLAVIEVKKKYQEPYNPTPVKLRKTEDLPKRDKEFGVDDNLIGQHGGELVIYRQLSASDQGLMGLIVQGTHVTFSYFACSENQYDIIKSGKYEFLDDPPSLMFSKSYNYLKASDREHLIEPLIILGLLQECP